jgi:hypothetical protein
MNSDSNTRAERLAGAEAISAKAISIGAEYDVAISECVWDIGEDLEHEHAHRLDLITETKNVRLYFRDLDLTTADNASRLKRTEDRLHRAVAQLVSRSPVSTYSGLD